MADTTTAFVNFHQGERCLAPASPLSAVTSNVPRNACDTHAHVFGPLDRYPCLPKSHYTPYPEVSGVDDYLAMLDTLGVDRGVLVQPSVYGTDNSLLLATIGARQDKLRGVVVIDDSLSDDALSAMNDAGVRGVRFNLVYRGGTDLGQLERIAARIAPLGWHVDILMEGRTLPEFVHRLAALPAPVVFDHMAQMPVSEGFDGEAFVALRRLLDDGKAHVKLSGLNRFSYEGDEFAAVLDWRRHLVTAAPHACLWGSDWPHVGVPKQIDTGALFNSFCASFDDEAQLRATLVDNATALYRFPDSM